MSEDKWKIVIDKVSPPLHIEERPARDHDLYLRWGSGDDRHRPKLRGLTTVRDEDGDVDPNLVTRARAKALQQYRDKKNDATSGSSTTAEPNGGGPLDLQGGFDKVLAVPGGKYPKENDEHGDMRRARDRVLEILGADLPFGKLRPSDYRTIWRTFAREYEERGLGWRMAEITVTKLYAAANWLRDEGQIETATSPPSRWREKLKSEWKEITGRKTEPHRPRYSPEEFSSLWEHLNEDEVDPRLRLCFELGAEYRLGQVLRSDRSDLDLSEDAGVRHGTFRIHGRPRKPGGLVYLTPAQREAVDHALEEGHLTEFEELYREGEFDDYPLFPGGKLRKGKSVPRTPFTRQSKKTMRGYFYELEDAAGIDHVDGRGWHGVRRTAQDIAGDHTDSERVLDALGGWRSRSGTRATVYEEDERHQDLRKTVPVRRAVRGRAEDIDEGSEEDVPSLRDRLREKGIPKEKLGMVEEVIATAAGTD